MADFGLGSPSDFGMLANQYNAAQLDPAVQDEIQKMLVSLEQRKKLGEVGTNYAVQREAASAPPTPSSTTFKTGPDGQRTVTTTMTEDEAIAYQRAMTFQKEALGGFAQQANQLQLQLQQAQAQPWQQLGTALAANMANQPGMPPWVRGLGATAAQMNPTVDQLRARYLATMGQGAEIAEKGIGLGIAQQRTNLEAKQLEEQTRQKTIALARQQSDDLDKDIKTFVTPFTTAAEARTPPPPFEKFAEMMKKRIPNVEPKQIVSEYEKVEAIAAGRQKTFMEEQKAKTDERVQTATTIASAMSPILVARNREMNADKRAEADEKKAVMQRLAKGVAEGDLMAIRDVASMRYGERSLFIDEIRKIDPHFSTAELQRKIDVEKYMSPTGKGGELLKYFGTYLQHAGEATRTVKDLELSGNPYLNKTWNWWRANMTGDPAFERLRVSLEPVGTEFEKILIGTGFALQKEERERIDRFAKGNMPVKQMMASLGQMSTTVKDRLIEQNHSYKRLMKKDIENPISPEAIAGAEAVGLKLPDWAKGESLTGPKEITQVDTEGRTWVLNREKNEWLLKK